MICKVCGEEGSEWNLFDEFILPLQIHERCLERAIEMGMIVGELELEEVFE